jgi:hypothetical protein
MFTRAATRIESINSPLCIRIAIPDWVHHTIGVHAAVIRHTARHYSLVLLVLLVVVLLL